MNNYTIIPSNLRYKSAPFVDQEISLTIEEKQQEITEYNRSQTISLAQVYDDERQDCTIFRPTFKLSYLYSNTYTGTTGYIPFRDNLYYVQPEVSAVSSIWKGYPQYYEFDFYRPDVKDQHFSYKAKSISTLSFIPTNITDCEYKIAPALRNLSIALTTFLFNSSTVLTCKEI